MPDTPATIGVFPIDRAGTRVNLSRAITDNISVEIATLERERADALRQLYDIDLKLAGLRTIASVSALHFPERIYSETDTTKE